MRGDLAYISNISVMTDVRQAPVWAAMAFMLLGPSGCASPGGVLLQSQATGSPYFSLSAPGVTPVGDRLLLQGRVCRRGRATLLSPRRVRIEHITVGATTAGIAQAYVPVIYRSADQNCVHYSTRVDWRMAEGETLRTCFDKGGPCPIDAQTKAVIAAPSPRVN